MAPGISIREYIRWGDSPADEPTSTIVLTSPGNRFVDLRILKPSSSSSTSEDDKDPQLPFDRLDWAIAGTSHSTTGASSDPDHPGNMTHSKWKHWISSRTAQPDGVVDEGDMFPLDAERTLEKGTMENPSTGKLQDYEEVWRDEEVAAVADDGEAVQRFVVLRLCDDANATRGSVVRLGQYCQGLVRVGEKIGLERWEWNAQTGWGKTIRMGELEVPCERAIGSLNQIKVGSSIEVKGVHWEVVEFGTV